MSNKKGKVQEAIDAKLLEDRKVFLWGMVDDDSAKHVIDRLLYLDMQNNKEIQLVINSPGGYVTSGFAIYDTIKSLKSPVSTVCSLSLIHISEPTRPTRASRMPSSA